MPDPFWNDYFAKQRGQASATQAQVKIERPDADPFAVKPDWLTGFVTSAVSSVPEMFGADPLDTARQFRDENPVSGFASQLVGGAVPYMGMFRLSQTVRGAAALESAMTRVPGVRALTAVDNPILHGAAKEVLRYSPLELSRLGVGFAAADDGDDYGHMLADVGLSTLLTGGFGGIGGFFRAGGKVAAQGGRVVGADLAFKPTFEFRMSRTPGAQVHGDLPLQDVQNNLMREVFSEAPYDNPIKGVRERYVDALENGTPETDALVNTLFKPSGKASHALVRQPFMSRNGLWNIDEATRGEVLGALGMESIEDLAEATVTPRLLTIADHRAAGVMAKALDDSPALQYVGDGVLMAREGQSGLWVVAKRVKAGEAPTGAKPAGTMRIAEGDQWLLAKTDQPRRFVPQAHKVAEANVAQWAKYREPFKPSNSPDIFNQHTNAMLDSVSPADYRDLGKTTKASWTARMTEKFAKRFAEEADLKGSQTFRDMADWTYDVLKPTVFKENQNPIYGRLYGLLRNNMKLADTTVNKIMGGAIKVVGSPAFKKNITYGEGFGGHRPLRQIWEDLSVDERQLVVKAAQTQTPGDDLAKLSADGLISEKAANAVKELQAVNQTVWDQALLPAFKASGLDGRYDLLEGYILPRIFKGDWFVPVLDEAGNAQWLASGGLAAAKKEAETVVEEAVARGLKWKVGERTATHIGQKDVDEIKDISELLSAQLGKSAETQEVVQAAMKRLEVARISNSRAGKLPNINAPAGLRKARTGIGGTPDIAHYELEDVLKASEDHYQKLLRFAGYHTWRERWMREAEEKLLKQDKTLYEDLRRKANQYMGIEGSITTVLNKALAPVLGTVLGGKAATRIAQGTNALMYSWNLAIGNPTFALLNLMNPLQTVAPWIAFVTKVPTLEAEKMMHTSLRYGNDGRVTGTMSWLHPMKVLGQSLKEIKNPDAALLEGFGRAKTDGTLSPQLYEGWVGGQSRAQQTLRDAFTNAGGGVAGGWEFIKRTSTFLAEKSEEFSRINAFTAAWVLGRDHFRLEGDALYRFAQRGTHVTMYGYGVVDRSRMFTGPIGSMFGLFKNWQFHFIGSMAQYAGLGIKQGIWAPLLWQGGAALALGGLGATPLKMLADGLARWQSDSPSSFLWLQENWHDAADEIYFGLPALLGASLQASASVPGTDVRNDLANLGNVVFLERAKAAFKATGEAWSMWDGTGENPLRDGNTRDKLLQAFAPRAVFRAFSSAEGEYIKSMTTGYPQVRGVSPSSKLLYGLGLNQIEVEKQQVAARELWNDQQAQRTEIQTLGVEFANAMQYNDRDTMTQIINRAVARGLPASSVVKSAHTRMRRETQSDSLSRFDTAAAQRYRSALGE